MKGDRTMADREPTEVRNLDRYGSPALLWSRARDLLALAVPSQTDRFFLGTVGPDGRPHAAGVGALWFDGDIYVVSGPGDSGNPMWVLGHSRCLGERVARPYKGNEAPRVLPLGVPLATVVSLLPQLRGLRIESIEQTADRL